VKGTDSRLRRWVWGDCACGEVETLLYEQEGSASLCCAYCYRKRATRDRAEACDDCGTAPAWRDPITRRNEFFCAKCHAERGLVFQNRWARANEDSVAQSLPLGVHDREVCEAAGAVVDSPCRGQVKPRGGRVLCDHHAGKKGQRSPSGQS